MPTRCGVLDGVAALVDEETARLPDTITVEVVQDVTSIIRDRLVMLVQNGVIGLVLVVVVMSLFFRPASRSGPRWGSLWPLRGPSVWMALTGLSLNMMTLVALLMAIGIVMDDSIVIADSIAVHAAKGATMENVAAGVAAVTPGVVSSFLTTLAVFLPLAFLAGELGAVLEVLPVVLLAALAASLIEAFFILPHHLKGGMKDTAPSRFRTRFDAGFDSLRERGVGRLADAAIRWRWLVAGLAIGALILTVGALGGGVVKREAMPEIDGDVLEARLMLPAGTPLSRTTEAVAQVEAALDRVNARLTPEQPEAQTACHPPHHAHGPQPLVRRERCPCSHRRGGPSGGRDTQQHAGRYRHPLARRNRPPARCFLADPDRAGDRPARHCGRAAPDPSRSRHA